MFNDIIYQNKFIESIQKPLQSLAAHKTVLALRIDTGFLQNSTHSLAHTS